MSDYTNPNFRQSQISRSDGASAKGVLVFAAVLIGLVVLMALFAPAPSGDAVGGGAEDAAPALEAAPAVAD